MHVHFDVLKGVPVEATVTAGNDSETPQLRATLQAQRLYVIDRGYADYQLFQDIIAAKSNFIGRIRDNAVWKLIEPGRPRRYLLGLPQIRTCAINAYGSSGHGFATRRHTE